MNNIKSRKYARTAKKINSASSTDDESELSLSSTAAVGILGGTFLVGLVSGKLIGMCKKKYF